MHGWVTTTNSLGNKDLKWLENKLNTGIRSELLKNNRTFRNAEFNLIKYRRSQLIKNS